MQYFVEKHSIVRKIWGNADTVLLIFAGSSAEFALNKAVDWLYYTGALPADPIGRLFSTVAYAQQIVFAEKDTALKAIEKINMIHHKLEEQRGFKIPAWAYRDVLYMLIDYSIISFEVLEHKLSDQQKEDVYNVFFRLGNGMHLEELPKSYSEWLPARVQHLQNDLERSKYTDDLYVQYKKHLGAMRYRILRESQSLVCPARVKELLGLRSFSWVTPLLPIYKFSRLLHADKVLKAMLMPAQYKEQIKALDQQL
jgi:hypothetical protein